MHKHVFPAWKRYFLINPLRRFRQNPHKILGAYIKPGMNALDFGCGMGYFSLHMAELAGPQGKITCVDIAQKMLDGVCGRAAKAGVAERVEMRLFDEKSYGLAGLEGRMDFALAFAVVHEVPDAKNFFLLLTATLKPEANVLVAEPLSRVSEVEFMTTMDAARLAGLEVIFSPKISGTRSALMRLTMQRPQ